MSLATGPADVRKPRRPRSHPAEVTADRLADHAERWHDKLTGVERDALSVVRNALQDIAEGLR